MRTFLSNWLEKLRSSYWFLPSLMAIGAIGISALTLHIFASSTITVAGVVFSITIVTLTLASSQFGPRLLRNFMNDRGTHC